MVLWEPKGGETCQNVWEPLLYKTATGQETLLTTYHITGEVTDTMSHKMLLFYYCFAYSSTLKMHAKCFSETSGCLRTTMR
jgi:hypothetical protein